MLDRLRDRLHGFERWVIAGALLVAFGFFLALAYRVGERAGRRREKFDQKWDGISDAGAH